MLGCFALIKNSTTKKKKNVRHVNRVLFGEVSSLYHALFSNLSLKSINSCLLFLQMNGFFPIWKLIDWQVCKLGYHWWVSRRIYDSFFFFLSFFSMQNNASSCRRNMFGEWLKSANVECQTRVCAQKWIEFKFIKNNKNSERVSVSMFQIYMQNMQFKLRWNCKWQSLCCQART